MWVKEWRRGGGRAELVRSQWVRGWVSEHMRHSMSFRCSLFTCAECLMGICFALISNQVPAGVAVVHAEKIESWAARSR